MVRIFPVLLFLGVPALVFADLLHSFEVGSIRIEIREDESSGILSVAVHGTSKVSAMIVPDPDRLVVDLAGHPSKRSRTERLKGFKSATQVRIGVHADKTRLVLDLLRSIEGDPAVTISKKGATVTLGDTSLQISANPEPTRLAMEAVATPTRQPPSSSPTPFATITQLQASPSQSDRTPSPSAAPTRPEEVSPNPTSTPAPTSTPLPKSTPSLTPTPSPSPIPTLTGTPTASTTSRTAETLVLSGKEVFAPEEPPVSREMALMNIVFDHLEPDREKVIRVMFSQRPEFRMVKDGESLYRISFTGEIKGDSRFALPHFPPNDFEGFTWIQAKKLSKSIEVLVGVDPGVRVSAIPRENDILVRIIPR